MAVDNTDSYSISDIITCLNTVILDKNKAPIFEGGYYLKIGGMWNLKHETRLPKFYEILIKT